MSIPFGRKALSAALLALLVACSDGGNDGGVTTPPAPVPGALTVSLTSPHPDDRALVLTINGPEAITNVESTSAALRAHSRGSGSSHRVALFGPLATGAVLRFSVPDVNRAASYSVTLVEVADGSNNVRTSAAGYSLAVTR